MFLFDPVDRYAPDGALQHLPNGCVPLDTSDVKMPCDVVKAYRPLTAAPLVADMVSAAMQGLTFRNAPLVFNLVIGTLLKDRSGRVTIHPNADSSDAPLAVIVFGAPCLLTVNAHRNDGGTRTVSVSSGSIVCLGPASMHGKKTLSVVLAKTGGGGSIVLVMRHASKAYTRVQLQRRLDNAEREKKKRAAALYAKLCAATTATVSGAVAIDEDDNNADNEEEEEGSEHNGGGCGDGNDDDEDDNDDDGALHASKKRMRG